MLGKQIQYYRKKEKYSQIDLASQLHVTRQAISNWEREISEPDLDSIKKLANIFNIPIQTLMDGDQEEIENKRQLKNIGYLYLLCCLLFVFFIFSLLYQKLSIIQMIAPLILMLMSSTLYFVFANSIRNGDFMMVAGYDDSLHYNKQVLCKILLSILLQIMLMHAFLNSTMLIMLWTNLHHFIPSLFIIYLINFFGAIFMTNIKYRKQIFTDTKDKEKAKKFIPFIVNFTVNLIVLILALFITFEIHDIHNNSKEALLTFLFIIPAFVAHIVLLFYVDHKVKNNLFFSKKWIIFIDFFTVLSMIGMYLYPY